jgi:hypothetical protein
LNNDKAAKSWYPYPDEPERMAAGYIQSRPIAAGSAHHRQMKSAIFGGHSPPNKKFLATLGLTWRLNSQSRHAGLDPASSALLDSRISGIICRSNISSFILNTKSCLKTDGIMTIDISESEFYF